MTEAKDLNELLDTPAKLLLRCFALGYALILLWVALYLIAGDTMSVAFEKLFGLAPHEANMVRYFGIALVKCVVLLFLLFPNVSIGFKKTPDASLTQGLLLREIHSMPLDDADKLIPLATDRPIWDRFFGVFPLVIVGSKEEDGQYNLAPKHMAMPLGWDNCYCFVCSPRHSTYHNIRRNGVFTVSYPRPTEVLLASLAAAPRCEDMSKPSLLVLPTLPARQVDGVLVKGCYLFLECTLHTILDGFGPNSLIIGNVVAATAHEDALRANERDESDQLFQFPLLAYVSPGRFAEIRQTTTFPFPKGFSR